MHPEHAQEYLQQFATAWTFPWILGPTPCDNVIQLLGTSVVPGVW